MTCATSRAATALRDPFDLDRIRGGAVHAGRIDDRHRNAVDVDRLGQQIARRAGSLRDDGASRAGEPVEEARLARVRPAGDRDLQSLADQPTARRAREQRDRASR